MFESHKLNEQGLRHARLIGEEFQDLLDRLGLRLDKNFGQREFAIVRTKLEEACFFAKRAMALDPANQEPV